MTKTVASIRWWLSLVVPLLTIRGQLFITQAEIYHVSPRGDNANPGTTEAPWASPGFGSKQMQGGDTLIIEPGRYVLQTYWDDMITPPSGYAGNPTIVAGQAGSAPVLACRGNLFSAAEISGISHLVLQNFEITSDNGASFRDGISGTGAPVEDVAIRDVTIQYIDEFGLDFGDLADAEITGCRITHCGFGAVGGPTAAENGWCNVYLYNCTFSYSGHYYQGGPGPSPYDRPDGFGIEPGTGPVVLEAILAEHNRGDGLDSKANGTAIRNCIVANNSCDGIKLWADDSSATNCLVYGTGDGDAQPTPWSAVVIGGEQFQARFSLMNVTVWEDEARQGSPMYVQYDSSQPIQLSLTNTIFAGGQDEVYIGDSVSLSAQYCLFFIPNNDSPVYANNRYYTNNEIDSGELGPGNRVGEPLFIAPAWGQTGDFHVRSGSPAIDNGTAADAPSIDLDYRSRPHGGGYDLGCYEFYSEPPPATPTPLPCSACITLTLNQPSFTAGDEFLLSNAIANNTLQPIFIDFYLVLDYESNYWFYPSWQQTIDHVSFTVGSQNSETGTPLSFMWPQTGDFAGSASFWGGVTTVATLDVLDVKRVEFSFE